MDEYSSSPSCFEVVHEEVKVSHGMFVATRQAAETFFHQIVPSQTLKVQHNPEIMAINNNNLISTENAETQILRMENPSGSFFTKLKACVMGKLIIKPSQTIISAIVFLFVLFWMHCAYYLEEQIMQIWKSDPEEYEGLKEKYCCMKKITWNDQKERVWFVGIKSGRGFSVVLKKVGIFLTISLALCTMWANHITVN